MAEDRFQLSPFLQFGNVELKECRLCGFVLPEI